MLKVLAVAHDLAPSRALRKLIDHIAQAPGHAQTDFVLLNGGTIPPPSDETLKAKVRNADIVVIGMSTPNATVEVRASQLCTIHKKVFGYFADTHGAENRVAFAWFREQANFVFVVGESEIGPVREIFPKAMVLATGNPLWAEFFVPRDRLTIRRAFRLRSATFAVLAPGTKNMSHTMGVWIPLVHAAHRMRVDIRFEPVKLFLSPHPRDSTPRDAYATLCDLAAGLHVDVSLVDDADAFLPAADVVINGTTLRSHAVARRIPVIDYYEPLSQVWLKRDTGSSETYYSKIGASIGIFGKDSCELADALRHIRTQPTLLIDRQTDAIPARTESEMLDSMYVGIKSLCGV